MESKTTKWVSQTGGTFRIFARSVHDMTTNKCIKACSDTSESPKPKGSTTEKSCHKSNNNCSPKSKHLVGEASQKNITSKRNTKTCIQTKFQKSTDNKTKDKLSENDVSLKELQINRCKDDDTKQLKKTYKVPVLNSNTNSKPIGQHMTKEDLPSDKHVWKERSDPYNRSFQSCSTTDSRFYKGQSRSRSRFSSRESSKNNSTLNSRKVVSKTRNLERISSEHQQINDSKSSFGKKYEKTLSGKLEVKQEDWSSELLDVGDFENEINSSGSDIQRLSLTKTSVSSTCKKLATESTCISFDGGENILQQESLNLEDCVKINRSSCVEKDLSSSEISVIEISNESMLSLGYHSSDSAVEPPLSTIPKMKTSNANINNYEKTELTESTKSSTDDCENFDELVSHDLQITDSIEHELVYLQKSDGVPRPILARGGIHPPRSTRGGQSSTIHRSLSDETKIKPHPLMNIDCDADWEKVLLEDENNKEEKEIFDNNEADSESKVDVCSITGNVEPSQSQDVRRKRIETKSSPLIQIQAVSESQKHLSKSYRDDKVVKTRPANMIDEALRKLEHKLISNSSKPEPHSFRPRHCSTNNNLDSVEDWTSELLDVPSFCSELCLDSERLITCSKSELIKDQDESEKHLKLPSSNNKTLDCREYHLLNPQRFSNMHTCMPKDSYSCKMLNKHVTEKIPLHSDVNKFSHCSSDIGKYCKIKNESAELLTNGVMSGNTKQTFPLIKECCTSSLTNISGIAVSDAFSDFGSVGSDEDLIDKSSEVFDFKKPKTASDSCGQISQKIKHQKRYSSQDMSITDTVPSMSMDFKNSSQSLLYVQASPKKEITKEPFERCGQIPTDSFDYGVYHPEKNPPFGPRMLNPFMQANWMNFYPYNYMYPSCYPCTYDQAFMKHSYKNQEETQTTQRYHGNKDASGYIKVGMAQDAEERKLDGSNLETEDENLMKSDKDVDKSNYHHVITVPLSKIRDLEQAQLLLHYVENFAKRMPKATGAYYKAFDDCGEPSLVVGATIDEAPTNDITHVEDAQNRNNHCHGNLSNYKEIIDKDYQRSSVKQQYQYQPRYPSSHRESYSGPYDPESRNGFTYPEGCQNLRELHKNYVNQCPIKMDTNGSPNASFMSYDCIADEECYDEDTCQNIQKTTSTHKQLSNDNKNVFCNNLMEQSLNNTTFVRKKPESEIGGNYQDTEKRRIINIDTSLGMTSEHNSSVTFQALSDAANKTSNMRYIPPHKRRLSNEMNSVHGPFSKFGQLSILEQESKYPCKGWRKYYKIPSQSVHDRNSMENKSNLLHFNRYQKAEGDSPMGHPYNFEYPSYQNNSSFQNDESKFTAGAFPPCQVSQSLLSDSNNLLEGCKHYRPDLHRTCTEKNFPITNCLSCLSNDNCLNNDPISTWKTRMKQRSKRYTVPFVDTHCHIDLLFRRLGYTGTWKSFQQEHSDSFPHNFGGCIAVFCEPRSFVPSVLWKSIAEEENIWIAMGCHPKHAKHYDEFAEDNLKKILQHPKVIAVGEIGLDYSSFHKNYEAHQKTVFIRQLKLCVSLNKPLVIHCREAEDDCLEIMQQELPWNYKIQCHCFSGDYIQAKKWLSLFPNLYLGLTCLVTYPTATPTHDVARNVPLNRIILETDSPYFIPRPLHKDDQKVSIPGFALVVAEEIARYKDLSIDEVLTQCRLNTKTLFNI